MDDKLRFSTLNKSWNDFSKIYLFMYRKGFINTEDLKEVFSILGESVTDDEVNSKIHYYYNKLL